MSSNFRFIEKNIDVSRILKQLHDNWDDWYAVSRMSGIGGNLNPSGFLPLTMGCLHNGETSIKDSEYQENTPWYGKYDEVLKWMVSKGITQHSRAAFFRLEPGGGVKDHIDDGKYYLTRDRYHLSLHAFRAVEDRHAPRGAGMR